MDYEILSPINDWIFKLLFGDERRKSLLINLLKTFVELPNEEYELTFLDTHLKPETEDDKLGILDVKVQTKTGKIINIEIQVNPIKDIGKRISFYKSKLVVAQISESDNYSIIQQVICICITDYEIFPGVDDYLNGFLFFNPKNNLSFESIPEKIFTLELPKTPSQPDGTGLWEWLQFLRAKTKEELEMVAERNPEIRKAANTLYELSADEEVRALYEQRLKARLDRNSEMHGAMLDGIERGRAEERQRLLHLINQGLSIEEIKKRI